MEPMEPMEPTNRAVRPGSHSRMSERSGYTAYATEPVRNQAQEEREADDQDSKRFTGTAEVLGGEAPRPLRCRGIRG